MQWANCRRNRGLKYCLRCRSWFVAEGAHSRFCAPCRTEVRTTSALTWRPHREQHETRRADDALVAAKAVN